MKKSSGFHTVGRVCYTIFVDFPPTMIFAEQGIMSPPLENKKRKLKLVQPEMKLPHADEAYKERTLEYPKRITALLAMPDEEVEYRFLRAKANSRDALRQELENLKNQNSDRLRQIRKQLKLAPSPIDPDRTKLPPEYDERDEDIDRFERLSALLSTAEMREKLNKVYKLDPVKLLEKPDQFASSIGGIPPDASRLLEEWYAAHGLNQQTSVLAQDRMAESARSRKPLTADTKADEKAKEKARGRPVRKPQVTEATPRVKIESAPTTKNAPAVKEAVHTTIISKTVKQSNHNPSLHTMTTELPNQGDIPTEIIRPRKKPGEPSAYPAEPSAPLSDSEQAWFEQGERDEQNPRGTPLDINARPVGDIRAKDRYLARAAREAQVVHTDRVLRQQQQQRSEKLAADEGARREMERRISHVEGHIQRTASARTRIATPAIHVPNESQATRERTYTGRSLHERLTNRLSLPDKAVHMIAMDTRLPMLFDEAIKQHATQPIRDPRHEIILPVLRSYISSTLSEVEQRKPQTLFGRFKRALSLGKSVEEERLDALRLLEEKLSQSE